VKSIHINIDSVAGGGIRGVGCFQDLFINMDVIPVPPVAFPGHFDGDGDFTTSDLVVAFTDDRTQFAISRSDGGWTTRRELANLLFSRGETHLSEFCLS
jgi:hypothetical protein